MGLLPALIAGGASLASGLFGRSSAKKQARREEKAIEKANQQAAEAAARMNREVRARADAAALVPVQTGRSTTQTNFSTTKDTARSTSRGGVDMKAFMAAAEENGFNPLTFLRSGALSLFSTSVTDSHGTSTNVSSQTINDFTCTTGERAMDAALSGQYMPQMAPVIAQTKVPGVGEVLGNALTSGANQYLADLNQEQNNQFQMDMLNRQLAGQNVQGSYQGPRSGYIPTAFLNGSKTVKTSPKAEIPNSFIDIRGENGAVYRVPNPDVFPDPETMALWRGIERLGTPGAPDSLAPVKSIMNWNPNPMSWIPNNGPGIAGARVGALVPTLQSKAVKGGDYVFDPWNPVFQY